MDIMRNMIAKRRAGLHCGIPSFCTANGLVIEACLEQAKRFDSPVLLEATANQVNQFGGYTGMRPADYRDYVYSIADNVNFPKERIILGGDHLGPLLWANKPETEAMQLAEDLVAEYVLAGFQKIHLDTSMKLLDDSKEERLPDAVIARRGARLYQACEKAYQSLLVHNPSQQRPVYVIGSEVPIPGGAQHKETHIEITKPEDLRCTLETYYSVFQEYGLKDALENVIAVVVQPGVEFGDDDVFAFDRAAAIELVREAKNHQEIVLEGHSTDYQTPQSLREMVSCGVAILKVGPALTFALREALYALSLIEQELVPKESQAHFIDHLENLMLSNPDNWKKHYHGSEEELMLKRKYSFSDRSRYYLSEQTVETVIETLFKNIDSVKIPLGLLHQYMPQQYLQVRAGTLKVSARELVKSAVVQVIDDYNYAVQYRPFLLDP